MVTDYTYLETPIGILRLSGTEKGIADVQFVDSARESSQNIAKPLHQAIEQIEQYFFDNRTSFHSLSLAYQSTDFQDRVWESAMSVPFGETVTYKDIAKDIGSDNSARAVGNALNSNPLLLIIPCHRITPVQSKPDAVGGFAAGTWRKKWLIRHESS